MHIYSAITSCLFYISVVHSARNTNNLHRTVQTSPTQSGPSNGPTEPTHIGGNTGVCRRRPSDTTASKTPGDNGFRIKLVGRPQPDGYIGGQVYTVVINGTYPNQKLLGFMLVAVPQNAEDETTTMGTFQHFHQGLTAFADGCDHVVTHTYSHPKAGVEILWTAPPAGSGCIEFRATVIEHADIWYRDDGALTKVLCEDPDMGASTAPELIPECCACGTGKYQMTFRGLWSRQSHPKDYPSHTRLLHWSNIVGMSHSPDYQIWQYGSYSSKGIKEVCEFGYPRTLEQEMREHSNNIRTVVKTPGIWWREPQGLRQTRWARFSVDRHKHLLSMISMLGPSPDWCAGVSSLNLCLPNCTWAGDMQIELYPFDAGTDDGITYMSRNMKSEPQQRIHRISNTFPNNPLSPFYGQGPIPPLAVLTLRRIHPKTDTSPHNVCTGNETIEPSDINEGVTGQLDLNIGVDDLTDMDRQKFLMMQGGKCVMSDWGDWSECSVTCGVGQKVRKRKFLMPGIDKSMCPASSPNLEVENCIGLENECILAEGEQPREHCALSEWSDWSPCSVTCGEGNRERRKAYLNKLDKGRCNRRTEQIEPCVADIADCNVAHHNKNFTAICALAKDVGPCRGSFTRWYYHMQTRKCLAFTYGGCRGNNNRFRTPEECRSTCHTLMGDGHRDEPINDIDIPVSDVAVTMRPGTWRPRPRLTSTTAQSTQTTVRPPRNIISRGTGRDGGRAEDVDCSVTQWASWSSCSASCGKSYKTRHRMIRREARGDGQPCPTKLDKRKRCKVPKCHSVRPDAPVDCAVSPWSGWSHCSATCGRAFKYKRRTIRHRAQNGGQPCPTKLERKTSCDLPSCSSSCKLGAWGDWSSCGATCGADHVQERSRPILQPARRGGQKCPPRLERRYCMLPECVEETANTRNGRRRARGKNTRT